MSSPGYLLRTSLEDRDSVSLWDKGKICLQCRIIITSLYKVKFGQVCSQPVKKINRSLSLGFLSCNAEHLRAQSLPGCRSLPLWPPGRVAKAMEEATKPALPLHVRHKSLRLRPRSLISSARILETAAGLLAIL